NSLTASPVRAPFHGKVVLRADGSFIYTPDKDYNGPDSFTYQVSDGQATSNVATASLSIAPVNDAPVVSLGGDQTLNEGATFSANGSFLDPDTGDSWTGTVDYGDGTGSQPLTLAANKTFILSHVWRDNGVYAVSVAVQDIGHLVGTATCRITIQNVAPQSLVF